MRLFVLLAAAALIVPMASGLPSLVQTISPGAAPFNGLQMAIADFRGDGHLELVAQSDNGNVYVTDPASGRVLATFAPGNAGCTSTCYNFEGVSGPINAPVVADLDRDGRLDIVVSNTAAVVARYSFDPAASTDTHYAFTKMWEHRYNQYQSFTTMDATPAVADLNGDGKLDILVVAEENGVFAVRADGTTMWSSGMHGGHASAAVRDLDLDGKPDVVVATDDGLVLALFANTGAVKWTFDARSFVRPASIPMAPTLADITGDGKPDVLFAARDAHDATNFGNDHFMFFALDSWGHRLWNFQPSWGAPLSHTRPIVVKLGGSAAILAGDWNTIGHIPGNFERVGPGHVFLLDATGHEKWRRDLNADTSNKDLAVADVVGDGTQQVIASGTQNGQTGLLLFDLATGNSRGFVATATPTRSAVTVGDLLHDGRFAMAVAVQNGGSGQVQIWHGTQPMSAAFAGWGAVTIPHGAPPTPIGNFTVTFGPKGNEWWVETSTASARTVVSVTASVDGGAAMDLPKDSWGTWARSIHAPAGSLVLFTARDASGAAAPSVCTRWINFTRADCPGDGAFFNATFTPKTLSNHWWVEVNVVAQAPLAKVEVRLNGAAWSELPPTTWGSFAKSLNVPAGTILVFRATSATGATSTSGSYTET